MGGLILLSIRIRRLISYRHVCLNEAIGQVLRKRFVEPGFVAELSRRLMVGGSLHIATDDPEYAAAIRTALDGEPLLENAPALTAHPGERREFPPTAFQREWIAQRRPCFFFEHRRVKTIAASRPARPSGVAS